MKILIIGGVAAGTSAAAKARRNDESAEIKIFEMDSDISYSGCGLPYYIGGRVESRKQLVPRDAAYFKRKYNVDVFTRHKVLEIDPLNKSLTILDMDTRRIFKEAYDKLVAATGANPVIPKIEGADKPNVFVLRNVASADSIREYIRNNSPASVAIVGSGFIGLELAENFTALGINTTVIEMADHVMSSLDRDIAVYLQKHLLEQGTRLVLNDSVVSLENSTGLNSTVNVVKLKSGAVINTDFVILSIGVKPNTELAKKAGIELGPTGAIKVSTRMQTSIPDIYACGDCAETYSLITGKPVYRPLGSTANKTGRIVGDQLTGGDLEFRGILGTGIFKVFEMSVAQTGLSESEALAEGYDVEVCHNIKPDKPEYFHGDEMVIKAVADRSSGKLLGAQIIGKSGIDKRIDVFVTALSFGAKAEDLFHLDLAYAPPFSTTKDPVMYTGMILKNAISKRRKLITAGQLKEKLEDSEEINIIDAREYPQFEKSHIAGAINIPQENLRTAADALDPEKLTVTYCNKGVTGNAAQNILLNKGFKKVYNLSGGHKNFKSNYPEETPPEKSKKASGK